MSIFGGSISGHSLEPMGLKAAMSIQCKNSLMEVIELQIIPRLVDSHPALGRLKVANSGVKFEPDTAEIIEFSRMCVQEQAHVTTQRVAQWVQHGYTMDDIFLKLIAPVARHLGWMWEEDELDFSQVSLGLIRLQQITHQLGYSYQSGPQIAGGVRRMMIGSVPGSQHLLGLTIVAEFFRKDGWEVVVEMADNKEDLIQAVGSEWFDLIGLSVGLVEQMPLVAELLTYLKSASRNPKVPLILGGPAFLVAEDKNLELGADGVSLDAAEAVRLGNQLVELPSVGA